MSDTKLSFSSYLNWFLSTKSDYVFHAEPWNLEIFAQQLCFSHESLSNIRSPTYDIEFASLFIESDYECSFLNPILKIQELIDGHIASFCDDVILHGSMATLDFSIGWSDIDISVILNERAFCNTQNLIAVRKCLIRATKYLYEIDPLQHHEFMCSTDKIMYDSASPGLPSEVLRRGKSLFRRKFFKAQPYNEKSAYNAKIRLEGIAQTLSNAKDTGFLNHHAKDGVRLSENFTELNAMYQMKYFLAVVMTLPVHYLEATGTPCYKGDSFKLISNHDFKNLEILTTASKIRSDWPIHQHHPFHGNRIPEWLIEALGENYFSRADQLAQEMVYKSS